MVICINSGRKETGRNILAGNASMAVGFFARFAGLMFRKSFEKADGLVLKGCGSIHTFFMKFPIDVVFLDRDLRVTSVGEAVLPWRVFIPETRSTAVIELPANTLRKHRVENGDEIVFL